MEENITLKNRDQSAPVEAEDTPGVEMAQVLRIIANDELFTYTNMLKYIALQLCMVSVYVMFPDISCVDKTSPLSIYHVQLRGDMYK